MVFELAINSLIAVTSLSKASIRSTVDREFGGLSWLPEVGGVEGGEEGGEEGAVEVRRIEDVES